MKTIKLIQLKYSGLRRVVIYRNLLSDHLFKKICDLVRSLDKFADSNFTVESYFQICHELIERAEKENFEGDILKAYILYLITTDENSFSMACEKEGYNSINSGLFQAAARDIELIKEILLFGLADIGKLIGVNELNFVSNYSAKKNYGEDYFYKKISVLKKSFTENKPEKTVKLLADFYHRAGCGKLCRYSSFRWRENKGLVEIKNVDPVSFDDLIGYDEQKEELIKNTDVFIDGCKANNVLLYGDSGTGKSSSVKALLNKYKNRGLRLIEITQEQTKFIPEILEVLQNRGLHFIIFMDDLSFEDFETDYKYLKAVMEGGIEAKPDNVVFYATSNRRHLIKEKWEEREDSSEVHQSDALQEKLSLSERFGITITYLTPDQEQYLKIVKKLANKSGIDISDRQLKKKALQWEKWYHGRSGRTARQFVDYLAGSYNS